MEVSSGWKKQHKASVLSPSKLILSSDDFTVTWFPLLNKTEVNLRSQRLWRTTSCLGSSRDSVVFLGLSTANCRQCSRISQTVWGGKLPRQRCVLWVTTAEKEDLKSNSAQTATMRHWEESKLLTKGTGKWDCAAERLTLNTFKDAVRTTLIIPEMGWDNTRCLFHFLQWMLWRGDDTFVLMVFKSGQSWIPRL